MALVTFTEPAHVTDYLEVNHLPYPVLVDPERTTYRAYGLGRGSARRMYGWRAARRYLQILRSDGFGRLRRPTEDTLQLGGDFVIGPDGRLVYGFWGAGPDDRPAVDELIAAVRSTLP